MTFQIVVICKLPACLRHHFEKVDKRDSNVWGLNLTHLTFDKRNQKLKGEIWDVKKPFEKIIDVCERTKIVNYIIFLFYDNNIFHYLQSFEKTNLPRITRAPFWFTGFYIKHCLKYPEQFHNTNRHLIEFS